MYHLQNLCTLCLQPNVTMKNIYYKDSDNVSMVEKLEFTVESLSNDLQGTLLYICEECQNTLNKMYAFKLQSIRNMNNLKAYTHQLGVMRKKFKHLSVVLDRNCVKPTKLDPCHTDGHSNDEIGNEAIYTNVEHINENVTLQNQIEEDISVFKREEDIEVDFEIFEKQISNNDIKREIENKLLDGNFSENRTQDNPFECTFCGKVFELRHQLHHHINIHFGEKFKCHICSKAFTQKCDLTTHTRTHTGEKPFTCPICIKSFSQRSHMNYHVKTHSGEKPFRCHLCPKTFKLKKNLNCHMRTHTGEKPFTCPICTRAFSQRSHMNYHVKTHSGEKPFRCHLCPKTFKLKKNLNCHIRTHTGEKPFTCPICTRAFSQRSHMNDHIRRTHTGEKPFKCNICTKAFVDKRTFVRHARIHTI